MRFIPQSLLVRRFARRFAPAAGLTLALGIALAPSAPAQTAAPVYVVTYLDVSTDWVAQGAGLIKQYRELSARQAGNLEFAVMQETARPNRFVIVEGWKDRAAFAAHEKSADAALFNFTLEAIRNSPPNQHVLQNFATAPARAAPGGGAVHMVEHVDFQPGFGTAGPPLVTALAQASQKEEGVVRYDILQEPPPHANHYTVVAEWASRAAYDLHETAAYTREFRAATVMPARANMYDQRLYDPLK
jgi:quinol monooxygenase YgiN